MLNQGSEGSVSLGLRVRIKQDNIFRRLVVEASNEQKIKFILRLRFGGWLLHST